MFLPWEALKKAMRKRELCFGEEGFPHGCVGFTFINAGRWKEHKLSGCQEEVVHLGDLCSRSLEAWIRFIIHFIGKISIFLTEPEKQDSKHYLNRKVLFIMFMKRELLKAAFAHGK